MEAAAQKAIYENTRAFAEKMDREDPLRSFREQFYIPKQSNGADTIYLCGNSLGLQPLKAREYVEEEMQAWQDRGVEGHVQGKHPWLPYHEFLTETAARLTGALTSEVVMMNNLTVNLHLLMVSFYRPEGKRFKIMMEGGAFPSDRYAIVSQLKFHGYSPDEALIEVFPEEGARHIEEAQIEALLAEEGETIALVLFGGVNYYTGQVFDMERIARAGQAAGCVVGFDLAHGAGNVELKLHDWNVDFAAWCSYKYLNGGPGATAGAFVHERHAENFDLPRFAGWWGHDKDSRFEMPPDFKPLPGAEGWQLSNPAILPMACLRASFEQFEAATMARLTEKSRKLTGYFDFLLREIGHPAIEIITPSHARGAQLSMFVHENGKAVYDRLTEAGVICDWREPNVVRTAPTPMYNTFEDVYNAAAIIRRTLNG